VAGLTGRTEVFEKLSSEASVVRDFIEKNRRR